MSNVNINKITKDRILDKRDSEYFDIWSGRDKMSGDILIMDCLVPYFTDDSFTYYLFTYLYDVGHPVSGSETLIETVFYPVYVANEERKKFCQKGTKRSQ